MELGQEVDEVLQAAAEPIDRPRHHHIELALGGIPKERIKGWALIPALGTADAVILVDLDDLAAHAAAISRSSRSWFAVVCSTVETRR